MPLIDLQTDLKSLKYGSDRQGGGDSGLPYIKTDINTVDRPFNRLRLTKFDDGLIRGGVVGALNASVVDTLRIGKFLTDFPKGPLFIIKQVGLQLSNPRLETKDLRTNRRGVFGAIVNVANRINNAVGPTRIYNLGLNTLAQVPVNAFGGHFNRHGLLPVQTEDTKYINVARANAGLTELKNDIKSISESNRLLRIANELKLGASDNLSLNQTTDRDIRANFLSGVFGAITGLPIKVKSSKITSADLIIDRYISGPNSVYGIGETIINRYINTEDSFRVGLIRSYSRQYAGYSRDNEGGQKVVKIKETKDFAISNISGSLLNSSKWKYEDDTSIDNSFLNYGISNATQSLDNSKQFAGYSRNTKGETETVKIKNTKDFAISTTTGSIFSSRLFNDLPKELDNLNDSFLTYIANNNDTGSKNIERLKAEQSIFYYGTLGVSKQYFQSGSEFNESVEISPNTRNKTPGNGFDQTRDALISSEVKTNIASTEVKVGNISKNYQAYKQIIDSRQLRGAGDIDKVDGKIANEFGLYDDKSGEKYVGDGVNSRNGILPTATSSPVYQNGYGENVSIKIPWNKVTREIRVGSGRQDIINLTPMFDANKSYGADTSPGSNRKDNIRDLIRFRIQAVNTDSPSSGKWMVFRAYLTDLSDDTTPEWTDVKYAGRGDKFYIYQGFTRKINISFKVAALSEEEMKFIYQKLNYLMGQGMPNYKDNLMRGPLVRMSVGSWIDSQLGIINSISFKVPQDSPWEIALDKPEGGGDKLILPHIVEVTLGFTPIGSETAGQNLISQKSTTTSHIAQNNTGDVNFQYIGS